MQLGADSCIELQGVAGRHGAWWLAAAAKCQPVAAGGKPTNPHPSSVPPTHTPPSTHTQGFIRHSSRAILVDAGTPAELLDKLAKYKPPPSLISLAAEGKLDLHTRG